MSCPPWCVLDAGHPFEPVEGTDDLERWHLGLTRSIIHPGESEVAFQPQQRETLRRGWLKATEEPEVVADPGDVVMGFTPEEFGMVRDLLATVAEELGVEQIRVTFSLST